MTWDSLLKFVIIILLYIFSAVFHEADLSNNFNKTGDANAWFYEIKCDCKDKIK